MALGTGIVKYSGSQLLSSAGLSLLANVAASGRTMSSGTLALATNRRFQSVTVTADGSTTQTITVTRKSAAGSDYDAILDSQAVNFANGDYFYQPAAEVRLSIGDQIQVTSTNTGTPAVTLYAVIECEE